MKRYEIITCLQVISYEIIYSSFSIIFRYYFGVGIFRDIEDLMLVADSNIFNIEDLVANGERRKHASYLGSQSKSSEN